MSFTIVGKKYSVNEFETYCNSIGKQNWVEKIILHNTATPSLAQRPGGILTAQHINSLHAYYEGLGWNGGPHLFVDATGIWVFNPLNKKGVHSPSYNSKTWGIEMLGNYQNESFTTGLGAAVANNAQHAMASLAQTQGWTSVVGKMLLHKEDPKTTHDCPGKNVVKSDFMAKVDDILKPAVEPTKFSVVANGVVLPGVYKDNSSTTFVPLRALCDAMGLKIQYISSEDKVIVTK